MARILYGYWRSSAVYRVRIALALKELAYEQRPVSIVAGAQSEPEYLALNPEGLVPFLIDGDVRLSQSLAIIDYLDAVYPAVRLLPEDAANRAHVLAAALAVACDIHPLNNLRVLKYLKKTLGHDQAEIEDWQKHWVTVGFTALETLARSSRGRYLFDDAPTLADVCLVPQVYNARRFGTDLGAFPALVEIDTALNELPAFQAARPEEQPDAPA